MFDCCQQTILLYCTVPHAQNPNTRWWISKDWSAYINCIFLRERIPFKAIQICSQMLAIRVLKEAYISNRMLHGTIDAVLTICSPFSLKTNKRFSQWYFSQPKDVFSFCKFLPQLLRHISQIFGRYTTTLHLDNRTSLSIKTSFWPHHFKMRF